MLARFKHVLHQPSRQTLVLFTLSLSLMAFCVGFKLSGITDPSFAYNTDKKNIVKKEQLPAQVKIETLNINAPIENLDIINGSWQISKNAVAHLTSSAVPGQGNNIVMYAHNKRALFASLPYIRLGQKITIITYDGKIHDYIVTEKQTVPPTHIDVVLPTNEEILTLFTCTGFADSKRFVVRAKPLSPTAAKLSSR